MKYLLLHFTLLYAFAPEPTKVSWQRLADVQFTRKLNQEVSMYFLYPTFGPSVNALKGKEISIKGYLIPLDPDQICMCFPLSQWLCAFSVVAPDQNLLLNYSSTIVDSTLRPTRSGQSKARLRSTPITSNI